MDTQADRGGPRSLAPGSTHGQPDDGSPQAPPPNSEHTLNLRALVQSLPAVLTVDELALLLRVNRKTAYEGLHRGDIPGARRVGRIIRVGRDAVLEWLAQEPQGRVSHSRR